MRHPIRSSLQFLAAPNFVRQRNCGDFCSAKSATGNLAAVSMPSCAVALVWLFASLFIGVFHLGNAYSQTPAILDDVGEPAKVETWFSWIDNPNQQFRTHLRIRRLADGSVQSATLSTDLLPKQSPLAGVRAVPNGAWQFQVLDQGSKSPLFSFQGTQSSPDTVTGFLEQANQQLPLEFKRLASEPNESPTQLGANLVWLGTSEEVDKPEEYRIRVYNTPPYAMEGKPRILFDYMSKGMIGIPATFTQNADKASFEIAKADVRSRYVARLSPDGTEFVGTLNDGKEVIPLALKKWKEPSASPKNTNSGAKADQIAPAEKNKKLEPSQTVRPESPPKPTRKLASSEFFEERPFEVIYGGSKQKTKTHPAGFAGIKISGIVTVPRSKSEKPVRYPAVVMVTGSGPQDCDETIGSHKPFATIAHFLAENGIVSLRYDDRGIGSESVDFFSFTTEDFTKDAIAVWKHAKTMEEVDPLRVGILGHSEGGTVGTMAAAWEPGIAFLILLAPHGLNGSDLSLSQIDRVSELQGLQPEDRVTTNSLQAELQSLAMGYMSNEEAYPLLIREAVNRNWEGLKKIALAQNAKADLSQIKQGLIDQIAEKFQQLRQPWYRFFMSYDPTTNWMLMRSPTLAIWGANDTQVLAEINKQRISNIIKRNLGLDAKLEILPGLNHLLQTSKTGLPDEYDQIAEPISPLALSRIASWAEERGLIDNVKK
ncbi:MAG: alpha/beta hydrolase [Pirellula sp.]